LTFGLRIIILQGVSSRKSDRVKHNVLLTLKGVKFCPFFGQNCSLPFSLRSLDIPALPGRSTNPLTIQVKHCNNKRRMPGDIWDVEIHFLEDTDQEIFPGYPCLASL
jgi:hypothetical protein